MTVENVKKPRRPRSFMGPILLITIGLIFLGNNLGLIPDVGWDTIWRFWPVLLILAGLNDLIRREGIAWPILLIGTGIFFLLNNFGPRVWISWTQIIQLWPILLIAAGIDLVFKGESGWFNIVGILLTIVLIAGAVWVARSGYQVAADYSRITQNYSDEIISAELDLALSAGEILVNADLDKGILLTGSVTPERIDENIKTMGNHLVYQLENNILGFYPHTARWELDLTDHLPVDLLVDNGIGEVFLGLEKVDLASLDLNQGIGKLIIEMPEVDSEEILIKQAVGTILVQIPDHTWVAVDAQNGLSKVRFPTNFELKDGYYVSPGANRKNAELFITVEQAIGLVTFQYAR